MRTSDEKMSRNSANTSAGSSGGKKQATSPVFTSSSPPKILQHVNPPTDYYQIAMQHFNKKEYESCIDNLNKLLKNTTNSTEIFKIKHNLAIAKYLHESNSNDNQSLHSEEKLLLELEDIKQSTKKHSTHQFPILIYNQSVLYFKKEKFKKVLELLEPLFESLDTLNDQHTTQLLKYDEFLVLKICFLLLDIYIDRMKSVEKSAIIIKYIDNNFQSIIQSSTPSLPQLNITELSITESKFNICFYKAKLSILRRDDLNTIYEYIQTANQIISNAKTKDSENYINDIMTTKLCLLESYEKLQRSFNVHTPAEIIDNMVKELVDILASCRDRLSPVVHFNNLGCIYMRRDFPNASYMSQFYLSKSCRGFNSQSCYNLALQLLMRESSNMSEISKCLSKNNPFLQPYELLHKASLSMYDNPYLWIRMGECIICEHDRLLQKETFEAFKQMQVSFNSSKTVSCPVLSSTQVGVKKFSTQKDILEV